MEEIEKTTDKVECKNIDILAIVGPTATGKTRLAIELAKKINGEIINADSMQVYKGFNIGTAKPTFSELKGVKYHLINIIDKDQDFSLYNYVNLAKKTITEIQQKNKLPILVGGTGLYIDAIINNININIIPQDIGLRKKLTEQYDKLGSQYLLDELLKIDVKSALKIDKNNKKKLIRALEINYLTGQTVDQIYFDTRRESNLYKSYLIGLNYKNRDLLYEKINDRVDQMILCGLVDEVREIFNGKVSKTSIQAIGYKEFKDYFDGNEGLESTIDKIKRNTRRYAKRQLTWFRKNDKIVWLNMDEYENFENIINFCLKLLEQLAKK